MAQMWHVTSVRNRESIELHGLDVARMGAARGIAGAHRPEADGVFLCGDDEVDWFVRMNNTGGPVDVWTVDGVAVADLVGNGNGYFYLPGTVDRSRVELVRTDIEPEPWPEPDEADGADGAYSSTLTITFDEPE